MATYEVTIEHLANVRVHPYADTLDLANISEPEGYQVVLPKGQFTEGDQVIYIPEGGIVPDCILEDLGLVGKLGGRTKNVVKAVKLRGEISQGLVMQADHVEVNGDELTFGDLIINASDLTEWLGVVKFVPEVAIAMSGTVEAAPDLRPMFEVENVKKWGKVFQEGESVEITEKIHGTCFVATYHKAEDQLQVSSKGLSKDHHALKEDATNLYWRAAHDYNLKSVLHDLSRSFPDVDAISVFGEVFGEGVQDLHYGVNSRQGKVGFAVYAMLLKRKTGEQWVSPHAMLPVEVPCVPILYVGPYSRDKVAELTDGLEMFSGQGLHMREGVVVQATPPRFSKELGGLALVKSVSNDYLTRKAGDKGVSGEPTEMQ